jgi:hypothetical protein
MAKNLLGNKTEAPSLAVEPAKSNLPVTPEALVNMGFDPAENLKDETPDIPMIKILPQAQMFDLPDGSKAGTVQGVVVYTHRCNGYWDRKDPVDGNRPTCSSLNDVKPLASSPHVQAATCAECPLNQYGSEIMENGAKGKGKACKNMRRFYILRDGHEFPELLSLSPTSLKPAKKFLTQLTERKRHIATTITKIGLDKQSNGSKVYSTANFQTVKDIDDLGFMAGIARISKQVIAIAMAQAITGAEYETAPDGEPF